MTRTWPRIVVTLAASAALALMSGCGGNGAGSPPAPSGSASTSAPPTSQPSTGLAAPSRTPSHTSSPTPGHTHSTGPAHWTKSPWTSEKMVVVHKPAVPPVPVVMGVRYAAHRHEGYDRIVFDIKGGLPGYTVRYVDQVRGGPSDRPVTVPGRRFLLVVLTPAQAHKDTGSATVKGVHRLDLTMMRGYAVVGDYEGYVSIAVGVDDVVGYRVGELPGRVYLEVAA
jgi:hypothetical protein